IKTRKPPEDRKDHDHLADTVWLALKSWWDGKRPDVQGIIYELSKKDYENKPEGEQVSPVGERLISGLLEGTGMGGALAEGVGGRIGDGAVRLATLRTGELTDVVVGELSTQAVVDVFDGVDGAFDGLMPKSLRDALQPRVSKPTSPDEGQREKGARGLFEF